MLQLVSHALKPHHLFQNYDKQPLATKVTIFVQFFGIGFDIVSCSPEILLFLDRRMRSASIAAGEPTEALSVKKSAEIAALFADIKLSQTTDITHLIPRSYDSRGKRSKAKQQQPQLSRMDKAYNSNHTNNNNRSFANKNKMYSAKNGLYTIQSQSDDSRRSSECDSGRRGDREYFNVNDVNVSSNIENSLGYLP